jgi:hypothetical protein
MPNNDEYYLKTTKTSDSVVSECKFKQVDFFTYFPNELTASLQQNVWRKVIVTWAMK